MKTTPCSRPHLPPGTTTSAIYASIIAGIASRSASQLAEPAEASGSGAAPAEANGAGAHGWLRFSD